ncbi:MAG TPA: CHAT domain-containing tetratricopeptide repeat protein [Myxococcaceae bacterium]|nr:CHAT domain-containing tetratricopeptide repeat protein [Myxococcaceae bacterium]
MHRQLGRAAVISWCVSLAKVFAAQGGAADPRLAGESDDLRRAAQLEQQGRYAEAAKLARRALSAAERSVGKEHPALVDALLPLARAEAASGQRSQAENLLLRALRLADLELGARHPLCATALEQLAASYQARGQLRQAEPLRRRAVEIRRQAQGEHHPDLVNSLADWAVLRAARGDVGGAVLLLRSALESSEWRLRRQSLDASGARLDGLLRKLRDADDRLYSLVRRHPDNPELARVALATALLRKGRSAEEEAEVARAIARDLGERDREAFEALRALRSELASATSREQEEELAARGDALEAELARRSAPLRAMRSLPSPDDIVDAVRGALPVDGALVELVEYEDQAPGSPRRRARYLALVLTPAGGVRAVDLGPAAAVDAAASRLDRALSSAGAPYLEESRALHALAVRPWWPLVAGTRTLYLAPDGKLGWVSFAALQGGRRFLADERELAYLVSGRDLLPPPGAVARKSPAVVFADPDFGGGAEVASAGERGAAPARQCVDLSRASWSRLPGTRREAEAVRRLFPEAEVKLGAEATKGALLDVRAPQVLHIATHGISDALFPPQSGARAEVQVGLLAAPPATCPEDPLLRSGLVLAPLLGPEGRNERGGGSIVTALELMGLDLWGTQLVVLSACASGRGGAERSEGVSGMRRAFRVAGAETVVTSLWPVDDETTAALMEAFYRRLGEGHGRAAALREAALEVRARYPHPHFWAPFISVGRDGPLRAGDGEFGE